MSAILRRLSASDEEAPLSNLLHATVRKLMAPVHSLRQACCHPLIVRGSYLPISIGKKKYGCACFVLVFFVSELRENYSMKLCVVLNSIIFCGNA